MTNIGKRFAGISLKELLVAEKAAGRIRQAQMDASTCALEPTLLLSANHPRLAIAGKNYCCVLVQPSLGENQSTL